MVDPSRGLRIGDAERETALASLGEHFARGRLTREEYDERADAVWTSRTAGDLRPLFADLPHGSPVAESPPPPPPSPVTGRQRARARFAGLPTPVQVLLALVLAGLVLAHLPLVLLAGVLWFVLAKRGTAPHPSWAQHRHRPH